MPKALHRQLMRGARRLGLTGDRRRAYVYGTLDKIEKQRKKKRNGKKP